MPNFPRSRNPGRGRVRRALAPVRYLWSLPLLLFLFPCVVLPLGSAAGTVRGTGCLPGHIPLGGARVALLRMGGGDETPHRITDAGGHFLFEGVEEDRQALTLVPLQADAWEVYPPAELSRNVEQTQWIIRALHRVLDQISKGNTVQNEAKALEWFSQRAREITP